MKYEFKDIKDVDLSKLEDDKSYVVKNKIGVMLLWSGHYVKEDSEYINSILLPCSPIVETDKLREEFNDFCGNNLDDYLSKKDKNKVFDFFLHNLSVSKEVEVSDSIDWNDYVESMTKDENSTYPCKQVEWNDNMLQGSIDKAYETLKGQSDFGSPVYSHNQVMRALIGYSNLCQKALFKALQIKPFKEGETKQ